jgi:hypothetical protein
MKKILGLTFLIAMFGCNSKKAETAEKPGLDVEIKLNQTEFKTDENILVSFSVKNNSEESKKFCIWQTPLEGKITANIFEIDHQGKVLEYRGMMIKRGEPQEKDSLSLAPKAFLEKDILINQSYDLKSPGQYRIRFLGRPINVLPNSDFIDFSIK